MEVRGILVPDGILELDLVLAISEGERERGVGGPSRCGVFREDRFALMLGLPLWRTTVEPTISVLDPQLILGTATATVLPRMNTPIFVLQMEVGVVARSVDLGLTHGGRRVWVLCWSLEKLEAIGKAQESSEFYWRMEDGKRGMGIRGDALWIYLHAPHERRSSLQSTRSFALPPLGDEKTKDVVMVRRPNIILEALRRL